MALRPLRNATITFGLVSIPVRFYTATKSEDVHFNLLHEPCGSRVNRKWWCPEHEEIIESDELVRAYAISKNKYVKFTDEEIDSLETDGNKALEITEFVSLEQIDPVFFEKAYYLGPAAGGGKTYKLLAQAMKKQAKVAVARWTASHKEHIVVLRPFEDGLILHTMYYADEVRDFGAVESESATLKDKEISLAEMLINELTEKKFDPLQYKDTYRERLLDRIKAKSKGETIVNEVEEDDRGGEVIDIMEALRRSLEGGGSRSSSKRSGSTKRAAPKSAASKTTAKKTTAAKRTRPASRKRKAS